MPASGDGFTPAVQTSVSAANTCPSDNRIVPSSAESSRVCNRTSMSRSARLRLRVRREVRRKLGQDLPGRLDQDPPHLGRTQLRVVAHRVAGQVLQLPQRLHPGVSGSDEHERQRRATQLGSCVCVATSSRESTWFRR